MYKYKMPVQNKVRLDLHSYNVHNEGDNPVSMYFGVKLDVFPHPLESILSIDHG